MKKEERREENSEKSNVDTAFKAGMWFGAIVAMVTITLLHLYFGA